MAFLKRCATEPECPLDPVLRDVTPIHEDGVPPFDIVDDGEDCLYPDQDDSDGDPAPWILIRMTRMVTQLQADPGDRKAVPNAPGWTR